MSGDSLAWKDSQPKNPRRRRYFPRPDSADRRLWQQTRILPKRCDQTQSAFVDPRDDVLPARIVTAHGPLGTWDGQHRRPTAARSRDQRKLYYRVFGRGERAYRCLTENVTATPRSIGHLIFSRARKSAPGPSSALADHDRTATLGDRRRTRLLRRLEFFACVSALVCPRARRGSTSSAGPGFGARIGALLSAACSRITRREDR